MAEKIPPPEINEDQDTDKVDDAQGYENVVDDEVQDNVDQALRDAEEELEKNFTKREKRKDSQGEVEESTEENNETLAKGEVKKSYLRKGVGHVTRVSGIAAGGVTMGWAEVFKTAWKEVKIMSEILWKTANGQKPPSYEKIWKTFFPEKKKKEK